MNAEANQDDLSRSGKLAAEQIAARVNNYWRDRGYDVNARAAIRTTSLPAKTYIVQKHRGKPEVVHCPAISMTEWEVVSATINGLPLGYRGVRR